MPSGSVAPSERIDALDVLRGIALFGVLAVNVVTVFRVSVFEQFLPASGTASPHERYRFGPVEWFWRSLMYGARQDMRVCRVLSRLHFRLQVCSGGPSPAGEASHPRTASPSARKHLAGALRFPSPRNRRYHAGKGRRDD
jgi:hypothetical protein